MPAISAAIESLLNLSVVFSEKAAAAARTPAKVSLTLPANSRRLEKAITKLSNKERGRLKRLKDTKLQDFYSKLVIESLCETEMYHAFQDMTVYFACFTTQEYNTRMFNNIEEYINLPTEVKTILADFCGALTVDIEALKK